MIIGRLNTTTTDISIFVKLIKSNAVPILTYGTAALPLSQSCLNDFDSAYRSIFKKLFKISDITNILQCQYILGCWSISTTIEFNRFIFLDDLLLKGKLCRENKIDQNDVSEHERISKKYNILKSDSRAKIKFKIWQYAFNNLNLAR